MPILVGWLVINIIILLILYSNMINCVEWGDMLFYPRIHEFLEDEEIGKVLIVIIDIFLTLLLLPALLLYFATFAAVIILTLVLLAIVKLLER